MAERTQRGKQEKREEEDILHGEPADTTPAPAGTHAPGVTRDKGKSPATDDPRPENRPPAHHPQ
jgi:hypothetical protein